MKMYRKASADLGGCFFCYRSKAPAGARYGRGRVSVKYLLRGGGSAIAYGARDI